MCTIFVVWGDQCTALSIPIPSCSMSALGMSLRRFVRKGSSLLTVQKPKIDFVVVRSFSPGPVAGGDSTPAADKASVSRPAPPVESNEDASGEGEILLYKESQHKTIMVMLGVSGVNFMVRSMQSTSQGNCV